MAKATFDVLSEKDKQLVLDTEVRALRKLDEEELLALHARVRRARNKHTKLYRQGAAGKVQAKGARAGASKAHARDRARAEVLEEALARVSRRLAAVAHTTAEELKATRVAAARKQAKAKRAAKEKAKAKAKSASKKRPAPKAAPRKSTKTPAAKKARAGSKASGKRRQAKRDRR